jgi:hypothetical protein
MRGNARAARVVAYVLMFFVLSCLFSVLSLQTPEARSGPFQFTCAISACIYPLCLVATRSKTGFWKGLFVFFLILTASQAAGFFVYLLKTNEIKYGGAGEDAVWYIGLELIPSYIISIICFPIAYWITRLLRWMAEQYQ